MARPRATTPPCRQMRTRLRPGTTAACRHLAARNGHSFSQEIQRALDEHLDRQNRVPRKEQAS